MLEIEAIGFIAGFLTTASYVPEVIRVVRTKDTRGISLTWLVALLVGVVLWLLYGVYIGSYPVVIANAITALLVSIMLALKLKYT
ncbi:MAG: SemiSWEET family sugar transporter [Nitrososphaeria archaeon]|jgi:MtN3 and saliva related transmembrane protein